MIVRFFRAIAHEGKREEFQSVFLEHVLPLIRSQEGLLSASVGLPHEGSPNEFCMHMIWRDLDAIRGFTGEAADRERHDYRTDYHKRCHYAYRLSTAEQCFTSRFEI